MFRQFRWLLFSADVDQVARASNVSSGLFIVDKPWNCNSEATQNNLSRLSSIRVYKFIYELFSSLKRGAKFERKQTLKTPMSNYFAFNTGPTRRFCVSWPKVNNAPAFSNNYWQVQVENGIPQCTLLNSSKVGRRTLSPSNMECSCYKKVWWTYTNRILQNEAMLHMLGNCYMHHITWFPSIFHRVMGSSLLSILMVDGC